MKYIKTVLSIIGLCAAVHTGLLAQTKKIHFDAALGISRFKPGAVNLRTSGIDSLIGQYADYYRVDSTASGSYKGFKQVIPFNISASYFIKSNWYLDAGIDYGSAGVSSAKTYQLGWTGFDEVYAYDITAKISYVIPHLGGGFRFSFLDIYGAVGLGFVRFSYTEDLSYSEPNITSQTSRVFKANGTAPALLLGVKYRLKLSKNPRSSFHAFVKLEALALKVTSLKGTKTTSGPGSQTNPQTIDGTLYTFSWNPYSGQAFDSWDLYETPPTDPGLQVQNFKPLALQLSGIRLMLGISF